jgi:oxaloacetate decarboxylase
VGISDQRRRVRDILAGEACIRPAAVFDPISARMAADLGFELGILAGSTTSLTVLGAPDIALLTLSELVEQTRRITRASSLPLIVDADHGYGNALSVIRTVQELETAGAAAVTIEDTILPRSYASRGMELISIEEGIGKMRAALAARGNHDLVIVARTNAMMATNTEDAVARARAYASVGPDALFFSGVARLEQLQAVREVVDLPLILGATKGNFGDFAALSGLGVRIALQGNQPILAAVQAVYDTLKCLRSGLDRLPTQAPGDLMTRVTRDNDYFAASRAYLGED